MMSARDMADAAGLPLKGELGRRLRRRREALELGLRETAARVGISPTYLSRIETHTERHPPAEHVIQSLARVLKDDFDTLMQLAGRVPSDVEEVVLSDIAWPKLLRKIRADRVTSEELFSWLERRKRTRGC